MYAVPDIDWTELAKLDAAQLQSALLRLSNEAMRGRSGADEEEAGARLPEPLRVMWLINWLDFEVAQGSMLAYFYNSHGRFAADAAEALDSIGARSMAAIVREAAACAANNDDGRLEELTDRYWSTAQVDDWGTKLDRFLIGSVRRLAAPIR